ncbi:hypothetical protein HDG35_007528 [Paraburkholderia sp. JPY681]|nr:hypothetical protein [Paraburkholderia atlantica]
MVVRSDPPPARGQPAIQRHQKDPSHTESNCKSIRENGSTSSYTFVGNVVARYSHAVRPGGHTASKGASL